MKDSEVKELDGGQLVVMPAGPFGLLYIHKLDKWWAVSQKPDVGLSRFMMIDGKDHWGSLDGLKKAIQNDRRFK